MAPYQDMKSSLPLQIATYFNGFYTPALSILTFLTYIYKSALLPYPPNSIGLEVAFVFFYWIIDYIRLKTISRGNKLELLGASLIAILLAIPVILFHIFMISWQTYVLRLDIIVNAIGLSFVCFEVLFGFAAALTFWKSQRF